MEQEHRYLIRLKEPNSLELDPGFRMGSSTVIIIVYHGAFE